MDDGFLKYYFENELYLENLPLNMKQFIEFCKKRGIKITWDKLEELESRGLFYPIFRVTNLYSELDLEFKPPIFSLECPDDFIELYNRGNVYIPNDNNFIEFSEFYDKKTHSHRTYSYYSSYQIYHLKYLLQSKKHAEKEFYNNFVNFLIGIQIYSPYGRSNLRRIDLKTNREYFFKKINEFNLNDLLNVLHLDKDYPYKTYVAICRKLKDLLGSNDAIQLWKNVSWEKKDKCVGYTRLGIEYLQWAMMLKRCIEEHIGREIFDVDEVDFWENVKNKIPTEETGRTLRGVRNNRYYDEIKGEYEFNSNRKRLFYLCNSLTLDYHPRVVLFVEGKTEEILIPEFFKAYGYNFKDAGFEIVNLGGITKFYNREISVRDENDNGYVKMIMSNISNLINFNLEHWQAIPFFIGDNENNIKKIMENGIVFDKIKLKKHMENYCGKKYDKDKDLNDNILKEWVHVWDYDFELDNFETKELQIAINEVCGTNFSFEKIQHVYDESKKGNKIGIKSLSDTVDRNKIDINKKALENLINDYNKIQDDSILEKPIFDLIKNLLDIAGTNYPPKDTIHLLKNKNLLYGNILKNKSVFKH